MLVAELLYILAPLLALWSSPSEKSKLSTAEVLSFVCQIKHISQLLGSAFFKVNY